ncbi:hypothetical protein BT091_01905, partial [Corynebacterium diphtheriae]
MCTIGPGQVASPASGRPLKLVTADNEDVFDPTVGQVGAYLRPKGRAFFLGNLQAHNVFDSFDVHIGALVDYVATITDFD